MVEANRRVFDRPDVVRFYAGHDHLQGGEAAVLAEVERDLPELAVLDIGIGGGRTTLHFAPRARKYVGVDYAPSMIAAARRRFAREAWTLDVADARSLPFANQSFDVALFSYCGIDYVDHGDRLKVLSEVRRVLAPGALFAFSTHNLQRVRELFEGAACDGRLRRLRRLFGAIRRAKLRRANPPLAHLDAMPHAVINDGAFRFAATTYHIRPSAQVGQLEGAGFDGIRVLSAASGAALSDDAARASTEPWLMYLARRR